MSNITYDKLKKYNLIKSMRKLLIFLWVLRINRIKSADVYWTNRRKTLRKL